MELDLYEWTQLALSSGQFTEPETVALMRKLLQPGDVFLDVGAHVGVMGLVARQLVGSSGRVIAVEPQPYNCERILRNWNLNGFNNLTLHVAAAGAAETVISLPQQSPTDKSRLSLALPMPDATDLNFLVPLVTLGSVITRAAVDRVRLLKIDVEGYELEVLRGLGEAAGRIENIVLEVLDEPTQNGSGGVNEIHDWCTKAEFELLTVTGQPWDGQLPVPEANLWARRRTGN
jgi:FkbM family methyltransferase